jgi:hypothetical protein
MKSRWLLVALLLLSLSSTGCAAWMSTQPEVGISTAPDAVFSEKVDVGIALGSSGGRMYMEVGGGVGYRVGNESPHADLHTQIGYESGTSLRWGVGVVGGGRVGTGHWAPTADPTVLEHFDTDVGGGVAGHILVRVPAESSSATGFYFGAAATTELVAQGPEGNERIRFLGTVGPLLRYVFDDHTESPFRL